MKNLVIEERTKLSNLLQKQLNLPFYIAKKLISDKQIKINGVRTNADSVLNKGDEVAIYFNFEDKQNFVKIFEDENLLIVSKPKDVETCGINSLEENLQKDDKNLRACYRLDRNTDGLVVFAKNDEAEKAYIDLQKAEKIKKYYVAIVSGKVSGSQTFSDYLFKDAKLSKVFVYKDYQKGAKKIETMYKILENIDQNLTKLQVEIKRGRTHQIRAHLSFHKIYILGDEKYGDIKINKEYGKHKQELSLDKMDFFDLSGTILQNLSNKSFTK